MYGGSSPPFYLTYPNFDFHTSFDPIVRRRYASDYILRLVMETLGGTTIDIDRSLREKKYRGTLLTSSGQHYVEMNFTSVSDWECIEYTDETYANVYKSFQAGMV